MLLNVKNKATNILRPGITINEYHKEVGKIMSELIEIKLLDKHDVKTNPKILYSKSILCMGLHTILV